MKDFKPIKTALISVYHKDKLDEIVKLLNSYKVKIYSTGGTLDFIAGCGVEATPVENLTTYPSILGGRVKTLHPKIFGGILARRDNENDLFQLQEYDIPEMDLVIVDLYPFEQTVASGASEPEIIEKIDIGGVSLIRAAAKNFRDVVIVSNRNQYSKLIDILQGNHCSTSLEQRKMFAAEAFGTTSHYDTAIFSYFNGEFPQASFKKSVEGLNTLRYGENPHQKGVFYGDLNAHFEQLHGKEISYNNLLDIDAAVNLIKEFSDATVAILKHNNACGVATRQNIKEAWVDALAADPVSAFGGVIIANRVVDLATAEEMNKIFFEVLIAPAYNDDALEVLKSKKNRILLTIKDFQLPKYIHRTLLNGVLVQERDSHKETPAELKIVTNNAPTQQQIDDLLFANIIVKHSKSNAIVFAKNRQLIASGVGQTSRVDAVKQAIDKARNFNFDLNGAVMASDAFFPFPDSVEIASKAGVNAVIQPGGSVKDQESIDFCNSNGIAMVMTGIRHFKH
ncbi:MAG TPA: bifunctional phosphoribosylaminoimidazolecarboxamide formyltransferase/IMP cyclohydrolase [Tenuifilaceae bacterium]|nr:bifunctional phosphoribosylaminoimidazolecarboxamide formyltransferase/IMP cyclohydrolase [Tenuifilaceae bacterium]HPI43928.1 bifunctional phosphoribosylaminoimidazolecarboxamide formyltransferase/IMP cyclohydrolase [Tenuifilaceae bacterium]HPN20470.1 bifunctional phosphoribosylaminoimidazolecarboxamide formyltransferase/IMP cyclohydrolase [Tenuifilaceae bacterium]HPV55560.1 bifunctional phosphoribosylaminoimidazolecarboxamide formyltransferase/IMP cyclohydrolase [Tenuifilaceae bacterium]